ncbi:MAG TPA: hypothetical protein VFJ74_13380 [Gemmatimonadaceae bacterium]|nr:hypothetical protein [Gemmatimonadaceae bacterium]
MRSATVVARACLSALFVATVGCHDATSPSSPPPDEATLAVTTTPDFEGRVTKTEYESAIGPAGPYAQWNFWVAIPQANGLDPRVVLPLKRPVFLRQSGRLVASDASRIQVGDDVQVWHTPGYGYGCLQTLPDPPVCTEFVYTAMQVVIVR